MSSAFTILQPSKLPCNTCTAECCSPVPFRRSEYEGAVRILANRTPEEVDQLAAQKREDVNRCMFVDMRDHTCSIYDSRPMVCEIFGLHPLGICTYAPEASTTMSSRDAERRMLAGFYGEGGDVVGISGLTMHKPIVEISKVTMDWRTVKEHAAKLRDLKAQGQDINNVRLVFEDESTVVKMREIK